MWGSLMLAQNTCNRTRFGTAVAAIYNQLLDRVNLIINSKRIIYIYYTLFYIIYI